MALRLSSNNISCQNTNDERPISVQCTKQAKKCKEFIPSVLKSELLFGSLHLHNFTGVSVLKIAGEMPLLLKIFIII